MCSPRAWIRRLAALCFLLTIAAQPVLAEDEKEGDDEKSFADLIDGAHTSTGFVTTHEKDGKILIEVPEGWLGRDLVLSAQNLGAIGDWAARGIEMGSNVVRFDRLGREHVRIVKRNLAFRADPESSIHLAVEETFPDSPVLTTKIESTHPEHGALLVDVSKVFSATTWELISTRSKFKPEGDPVVLAVHNNPENLAVHVAFHYQRGADDGDSSEEGRRRRNVVGRLADDRNVEVRVQFDLFALPDSDYRPRAADERLSVWSRTYKDYTDIENRRTAFRYLAQRWDVRKTDPAAASSPAAEPITFYIDRSVPDEIRPLVRAGALWWNEAFAAVGIENALRVENQPDDADWHPTDIRYSMIYWNVSDNLNFSGMAGPQLVDPLTGQVLKANVYLNAEFLGFARHRYLVYSWWRAPGVGAWERERGALASASMTAADWGALAQARDELGERRSHMCDYAASFSSQLAFARLVLQSRGILQPDSPEEDRYAREAFLYLVAHEVGHALGFGHNFKASRYYEYDDILSGKTDDRVTGSIMDYNPINLPRQGEEPAAYFNGRIGEYDLLVAQYLYMLTDGMSAADEAAALDAIAARAETKPGLAYDGGTWSSVDPSSSTDDLGRDGLRFAQDRLDMVNEVLPDLPRLVLAEGHEYNVIQQALDSAIISVAMDNFDLIARHVGGRHVLRLHHHGAGGEQALSGMNGGSSRATPLQPFSSETQHRALELLDRYLFADEAFVVEPDLLDRLQADMQYDWNYPFRFGRDFVYETRVTYLYGLTLSTLLEPRRLARIKDNEARLAAGAAGFTLPDLFDHLTASVFQGFDSRNYEPSGQVSSMVASKRRALHRMYVGMLADLALEPAAGTPTDASTLAAMHLKGIRARARRAVASGSTGYGAAHLADLQARAERVLEARVEIPASAR